MINTITAQTKLKYEHPLYSITSKIIEHSSYFRLTVQSDKKFTTKHFPNTHTTLMKIAPDVLNTHCFNENSFAFTHEVKDTELAHLFEHIIIQKLAILKHQEGISNEYSGETYWDWYKEKEGVFHIDINCGFTEYDILEEAFHYSIEIFNQVISS